MMATQEAPQETRQHDARRLTAATFIVAGVFFIEVLDSTIIATALPRIAEDFSVPAVNLSIGMAAYLLAMAVCVPASGWVADRLGARRVFTAAIALFSIASILCGLAGSVETFTAARVLQGMAGAMMSPVGRLIVLRNTEKRDLVHAIAVLVWPALTAPVLGPAIGGFITTWFDWRWNFFINVPLGVIALIATALVIRGNDPIIRRRFDLAGFLLTGITLGLLLWGLELLGQQQPNWRLAFVLLVAGLLTGIIACRHLRRTAEPMIDLSAMAARSFSVSVIGGTLFRTSVHSAPFLLPLMFQLAFGLNPFESGLLVLWLFAGNLVMKLFTTQALLRFGFRRILILNGLLSAATIAGFSLFSPATPYAVIAVVLFLAGMFRSMQFTAISTLTFADIPQEQMSRANGFNSMVNQLGVGLGIAIGAVTLQIAPLLHGGAPGASGPTLMDFQLAFLMTAGLGVFATLDAYALKPDAGAEVSGHRS